MKSIQKQTFQSSIFGYLGIAIGFISQGLLVGRYFDEKENGLINVILAIAYPLSILANLGFNGAATRFFPYFRDSEKKHHGFLKLSIVVSLIGFSIISILMFFFRIQIETLFNANSPLLVRYYNLILPVSLFLLIFSLLESYSKLMYDSVTSTFLQSFFQRFLNLILIVLVILGYISFHQYALIWPFTFFAICVMLLFSVIKQGHFYWSSSKMEIPSGIKIDFLRFSIISVMTSVSSQIVFQIDKIMLSMYKGLGDSGIFSIAFLFGTVIAFPATALLKSSSVYIAEAWKSNDLESIAKIYKNSCIIQFIVGMLIFLGLVCNLHNVFPLIKPVYRQAEVVIYLIGLAKMFDMATGINGLILSTSKYYLFDTISFIVLSVLTVGLNHFLIPIFGVNGAGIAALFTIASYNLSRHCFLYYKFGFQPFDINFLKVILIGSFIYFFNWISPRNEGDLVYLLFDLVIRSLLILFSFLGLIYIFRVSLETNLFFERYAEKLRHLLKR